LSADTRWYKDPSSTICTSRLFQDSPQDRADDFGGLIQRPDYVAGAFGATATSSIKLARVAPEEEVALDVPVAEAVLEFGDDLRAVTQTGAECARGG
jgi:hypothetical protein